MRQVFLYQTHFFHKEILDEFEGFAQGVQELGKAALLFHGSDERLSTTAWSDRVCQYSDEDLASLGYKTIRDRLSRGHSYFLLMRYFQQNPGHPFYWCVEYDVRYTGRWQDFFASFDDNHSDFLTSNVHPYHEMPDWHWWELEGPERPIQPPDKLRSFNPVFRLSRRALKYLHTALSNGWCGHYEVLLPTLLHRSGFTIEDFGGNGPFVSPDNIDRHYIAPEVTPRGRLSGSGTLRYRPEITGGERLPGKLYHPLKPKD